MKLTDLDAVNELAAELANLDQFRELKLEQIEVKFFVRVGSDKSPYGNHTPRLEELEDASEYLTFYKGEQLFDEIVKEVTKRIEDRKVEIEAELKTLGIEST